MYRSEKEIIKLSNYDLIEYLSNLLDYYNDRFILINDNNLNDKYLELMEIEMKILYVCKIIVKRHSNGEIVLYEKNLKNIAI